MSDSDSDDSLLAAPTFAGKRKRGNEKRVANGFEALDKALNHSERLTQLDDQIEKIKQEDLEANDEELVERVEQEISKAVAQESSDTCRDIILGLQQDDDDALGRDRRLSLAAATDTAQSSCVGVRHTIRFTPGNIFVPGKKDSAYTNDLNAILRKLNRNQSSNDTLKKALVNPFSRAIKFEVLAEFLQAQRLARLQVKYGLREVPDEITMWLFGAACSGESPMSRGAYNTLKCLLSQTDPLDQIRLSLDAMHDQLGSWIGSNEIAKTEEDELSCSSGAGTADNNMPGFSKFLRLWSTALRSNKVSPSISEETETEATALGMITKTIVALIRAGLDASFYSVAETFGLKAALHDILCEIVSFVAKEICTDQKRLLDWIDQTSVEIVKTCSSLGPGAANADDAGDDKAYLCVSLAANAFPDLDHKYSYNKNVSQFKACLSMEALRHCVGVDSWIDEINTILSDDSYKELREKANEMLRWKAMVSALVALEEIVARGDEIAMDGPRCLALVELSSSCLKAGQQLIKEIPVVELVGCEYRTKDEAEAFSAFLEAMEKRSSQLATRMNRYSSNPLFRRIAYRLNCVNKYYNLTKEDAKFQAGIREDNIVQKNINNWFKPSTEQKAT